MERREGLVRDDYLSGIFGGITMAQYHRIARLPGVQVAAPIAMIGYVLQSVQSADGVNWLTVTLGPRQLRASRELFLVEVRRSPIAAWSVCPTHGVCVCDRSPADHSELVWRLPLFQLRGRARLWEVGARVPAVEPGRQGPGPVQPDVREAFLDVCVSKQPGGGPRVSPTGDCRSPPGGGSVPARGDQPTGGGPLGRPQGIGGPRPLPQSGAVPTLEALRRPGHMVVPVLASTRPYVDDADEVTVSRLSNRAAQAVLHTKTPGAWTISSTPRARRASSRGEGSPRPAAYRRLLDSLTAEQFPEIDNYWTSGPTTYRQTGPRQARRRCPSATPFRSGIPTTTGRPTSPPRSTPA